MNRTLFTGKRVLAALLLTSLFIVSCGPKIEYRKDGTATYEIVTDKGIKIWGIVIRDHEGIVIDRPLDTKYDSIYCSPDIEYLYFALQNGNVYAFSDYGDMMLFDENPVNKVTNSDDLYKKYSNSHYGNIYNVANTDKGNYYFRDLKYSGEYDFCFGPYENFYMGYSGYAYQENGKWGVYQEKTLKGAGSKSSETRYIPFLSAKYDAAIEVVGPQDYWLVKENGVWKAFSTTTGEELKKSDRVVNLLLGLPILDWRKFDSNHYPGTDIGYCYRRIGGPDYGTIKIRDKYIAERFGY